MTSEEKLRRELAEAQQALADLQTRVDNAQQLANMGDYDWHIATDTNSWSDQLYRIYGHEPGAFNAAYDKFLEMVHPDDREKVIAMHQEAYATGGSWRVIERIVRPDGEIRYLHTNGVVVTDDTGTPIRMRGTCVDVTERVRAEEESERLSGDLREAQVRRRQAFELNDQVVQGLAVAAMALHVGDLDAAGIQLDQTLAAARTMMSDLLLGADLPVPTAGSLVRTIDAKASVSTPPPPAPPAARILLADDYEGIRTLMRYQLEKAGYEVVGEASDGASAVALAIEQLPDVVVIDLAMPVMDGLEAIPMMRNTAPGLRIIVLSGFSTDTVADQALAAGASRFVEKSRQLDLVAEVRAVLSA
ncbi:MAG TPA: response regulator [Nocardioides sp.]|nr:response regulator [Nocardioides sp.]